MGEAPLKSLNLTANPWSFIQHYQIACDGQPIYFVNVKSSWFSIPQVNIQIDAQNGPIVAAARARACRLLTPGSCRVILGDPDCTEKADWNNVDSNLTGSRFDFTAQGRRLVWKRTHRKSLGASRWSEMDFKLVDRADEAKILAVYVANMSWKCSSNLGRIEYFDGMDQAVELMSLAVLLAIHEEIRTERRVAIPGSTG